MPPLLAYKDSSAFMFCFQSPDIYATTDGAKTPVIARGLIFVNLVMGGTGVLYILRLTCIS